MRGPKGMVAWDVSADHRRCLWALQGTIARRQRPWCGLGGKSGAAGPSPPIPGGNAGNECRGTAPCYQALVYWPQLLQGSISSTLALLATSI